jgi:hypothetical protein
MLRGAQPIRVARPVQQREAAATLRQSVPSTDIA